MEESAPPIRHDSRSRRQAILVLGMHRSGTSALSGVASMLAGSTPRTPAPPTHDNQLGYWESQALMHANEELLASATSSWDDWKRLRSEWFRSEAAKSFHERLKEVLASEFGEPPLIVVKDPRVCRLMPIFLTVLEDLNLEAKALFALRNPLEVANSLNQRDGFSIPKSILLWMRNNLDAEFHSRNLPRSFIDYSALLTDWRSQMTRAANDIDIVWPNFSDATAAEIDRFVRADLHRQRSGIEEIRAHPDVSLVAREVWRCLSEMAQGQDNARLHNHIDGLRARFNEACDLFDDSTAIEEGPFVPEGSEGHTKDKSLSTGVGQATTQRELIQLKALLATERSARTGLANELSQLRSALSDQRADFDTRQISHNAELERIRAGAASVESERDNLLVRLNVESKERAQLRLQFAIEKLEFQRVVQASELKDHELDKLRRDLSQVTIAFSASNRVIDEIRSSTIWATTEPLRRMGNKLPLWARRGIRESVKYARWIKRNISVGTQEASQPGTAFVDGNNTSIPGQAPIESYDDWVMRFDTLFDADRDEIRNDLARFANRPKISIVMPVYETPEPALCAAIDSVLQQLYPDWELCIADDASASSRIRKILESYSNRDGRIKFVIRKNNGNISAASNSALSLATGEYVALLDHDDVLPEHALYMVAKAINQNPEAEIFYSDEDKLDENGRRFEPHFKSDWNPELFLGQNYVNHLTVYKRSAVERVGGFREGLEGSQDYDLALRVMAGTTGPIVHIPAILYHWRIFRGANTMSSTQLGRATAAARRALVDYFNGKGTAISVKDVLGAFHRVARPDPVSWPRISVVIPTRDHVDLLKVVVSGLLEQTDYPDLEILIADNESVQAETHGYFQMIADKVRVIPCPGPFNFSDINNRAIFHSTGELILLLNNDVEIIEPNWLKEMAIYFSDPSVGVVGAKLLYPDGTLQHAGVVIGIGGVAGHRMVGIPGDNPGTFGRLALSQDVSCVTAACMLVRRSVFDQVGGLDSRNLKVAFNDVDFCLKVRSAGHRIIWTPFAILHHHESKSRGLDLEGEKRLRFEREATWMIKKWGATLQADPFYNPNLSLETTNMLLANPPRVAKPWKKTN